MAAIAYLYPMSATATPSTQQPRPTLRRATYVHISDLTSAYNIDHARLEQELSRVKAERGQSGDAAVAASISPTHSALRSSSAASEVDAVTVPGVASDIETVIPQKRLQPPRGGFNLCV